MPRWRGLRGLEGRRQGRASTHAGPRALLLLAARGRCAEREHRRRQRLRREQSLRGLQLGPRILQRAELQVRSGPSMALLPSPVTLFPV